MQTEVPDYVLNPNMDMPKQEIDGINYVGILSVPELGLELPVADEWSYANLKTAPCRFFGSAYRGNLVICAHNYLNHFGTLRNLTIGAQIAFTDMDGNMFRYTVAELETLLPTEVEQMKNGDWALTLFTCTVGGRTRLTVRCLAADNIQ
ncbi:MAG: sortase [Clostridia bacterium]|nr:sortase [Clostridia bacterium]